MWCHTFRLYFFVVYGKEVGMLFIPLLTLALLYLLTQSLPANLWN